MTELFLSLALLLFVILSGMVAFLYFEYYLLKSPLGVTFAPITEEEEKLQKEYPDLKTLYVNWQKLKTKIIYQDWRWNDWTRPTQPIRAFIYRFMLSSIMKKKIKLCNEAYNEYYMCVKLLKDY